MRIHLGGGEDEHAYYLKVTQQLRQTQFPDLPTKAALESFFALCEELPSDLNNRKLQIYRLIECMPEPVQRTFIASVGHLNQVDRQMLAAEVITTARALYTEHKTNLLARQNERPNCRHCGLPAHYGRGCRKPAQLALPSTRSDFPQGGHQ
jgi:hypothetical protein